MILSPTKINLDKSYTFYRKIRNTAPLRKLWIY
jgi:hypothetical protein